MTPINATYEYKTFTVRGLISQSSQSSIDEAVNGFDEDGWELVTLTDISRCQSANIFFLAVCRRPRTTHTQGDTPSEWLCELHQFQTYVKTGHILGINIEYNKETDFFDQAGYQYTGIEEQRRLWKLKEKFPKHTFIGDSIYDTKLVANSFDGCWSPTLFTKTPPHSIAPALQTLKELLKDGSYCFFAIQIGKEDYVDSLTNTHYYLYSEKAAKDVLENNGFFIHHQGYAKNQKKSDFSLATYFVRMQK